MDAQIHLWGSGLPSNMAHCQVTSFTTAEAVALMDEGGVDAAVIHPPGWDPKSTEMAFKAVRDLPGRFDLLPPVPRRYGQGHGDDPARRYHRRAGGIADIAGLSGDAMAMLEGDDWPGNVRELEAVVKRAMVWRRRGWVRPDDIALPKLYRGRLPDATRPPGIQLTPVQEQGLQLKAANGEVRHADLAARCRVSHQVARRALAGLARLGCFAELASPGHAVRVAVVLADIRQRSDRVGDGADLRWYPSTEASWNARRRTANLAIR